MASFQFTIRVPRNLLRAVIVPTSIMGLLLVGKWIAMDASAFTLTILASVVGWMLAVVLFHIVITKDDTSGNGP